MIADERHDGTALAGKFVQAVRQAIRAR